jgi:Ca-activated chloride channel family protein
MNWTAWGVELECAGGREAHLLISATGADTSDNGEDSVERRPPLRLNVLLDRSGSMKGAPLGAAVEAVQRFLELVDEGDHLGLLVFDGIAEQRVPLRAMDAAGKRAMVDGLQELAPGRGTALHQAVELGARELERVLVPGSRPKLLLLTDGEPSVGLDREEAFVALGGRLAQAGISVHALGLARHYVAEILSALCLPSGNAFEHVDGPEGISEALGSLFARLIGVVSSGLKVTVTPRGLRSLSCRHGYPSRTENDALVVTLGELSRGLTRRVLFSGPPANEPQGWELLVLAEAQERGDSRYQRLEVERVEPHSPEGRLVAALGLELELASQETAAWLSLARKDFTRALQQLEGAERAWRGVVAANLGELPVRRHQSRLADLRRAIEHGDGDLPLLVRRARSAHAGTHVSQVIPLRPRR